MSDYICKTHQWRLNNDDSPCPYCEISRLKAEMERVLVNSAEMMQNQSNEMLKLMEENRDLERQLAEARAEIKEMTTEIEAERKISTGLQDRIGLAYDTARQHAAREVVEIMGGWPLKNSTLADFRGRIIRHFGLEE